MYVRAYAFAFAEQQNRSMASASLLIAKNYRDEATSGKTRSKQREYSSRFLPVLGLTRDKRLKSEDFPISFADERYLRENLACFKYQEIGKFH